MEAHLTDSDYISSLYRYCNIFNVHIFLFMILMKFLFNMSQYL